MNNLQESTYLPNIFEEAYTYTITTKTWDVFSWNIPKYLAVNMEKIDFSNIETCNTFFWDRSRQGFERSQVNSIIISPINWNEGEKIITNTNMNIMTTFDISEEEFEKNKNGWGSIHIITWTEQGKENIQIRFLPYARILMEKYFNHQYTDNDFFRDFAIIEFLKQYPSLYTIKTEDKLIIDTCVNEDFVWFQYTE